MPMLVHKSFTQTYKVQMWRLKESEVDSGERVDKLSGLGVGLG